MNRFTFSCEVIVPIEAESVEEIYVKLSEMALASAKEYEQHNIERYRLLKINRETGDETAYEKVKTLRTDACFELFGRKFDAHDLTYRQEKLIEKKKGRAETIYGEREFAGVEILTLDEWFAEKD